MTEDERTREPAGTGGAPLGQLNGVPVEVVAELARTTTTVGEVLALRPGSTVTLEGTFSDEIDLMVGTKRIATGEMVAVDEELAVRLTEVEDDAVSPDDAAE